MFHQTTTKMKVGNKILNIYPSYLGRQYFLHGMGVVKHYKSKVGQLPTHTLCVDPQLHNISICCKKKNIEYLDI